MRPTTRLAWAILATAAAAAPAPGQTSGNSSGGSSSGGSSVGSSLGSSLSSSSGGGGSSGSSGGGGSGSGSADLQTTLATMQSAPGITAPSAYATSGTSTNTAVSTSNAFQQFYANPYYQGRAGAQLNQVPGGFGVALYGSSSGNGTGGGNIGFAGAGSGGGLGSVTGSSSTSTFGRSGGAGGTGGTGGRVSGSSGSSGGVNLNNPGGQIVPLPRQIAYQAVLRFQPPAPAPAQVQADIRGMLDRSNMLVTQQGVQVIADGSTVVLRGAVRDEEEARTIEGMVRLTPGVHLVKNEMSYPRQ